MSSAHSFRWLLAGLLCLPFGTTAATGNVGVHYTDFGDGFGDGFTLSGEFGLGDSFLLHGDFSSLESDVLETDILRIGADWLMPLNEEMRLRVGGRFQNWDVTVPGPFGGGYDDNAIAVGAGLDYFLSETFRLEARGEYLTFLDDDVDDFVLSFGAAWRSGLIGLSGQVEAYTGDVDETRIQLGLHFHFD
ncbi:hypothetical protein [Natronospira bacteriovora]|uniref:Outer membrane protein beta-barrel domain-containing protein n=1 Tax=Natronospira bacteriovora TaxID=3069753 RepID=A0ABU0W6R7_9GAMM|nr:hypothetical protein [Natronospira sp. AB-CW4]MDQ2069623.1 hypothetical protein [Natronospira sp. AB-CW4]